MTDETRPLDTQAIPHWQICSECCLILFLPKPVSLKKQQRCWALAEQISRLDSLTNWVLETVVGMNTLTVYTKPVTYTQLVAVQQQLQQLLDTTTLKTIDGNHIDIPVRYGGEYGPDLVTLAEQKNMRVSELVALHTEPVYTVYFMGFQPGFPYLGGLPESLYSPRHATPRLQVPAGSVGIGGEQTGIYPFASPGGWQLLGRTELPLFDLSKPQPTLLKAGDTLRFVAIDVIE